MSVGLGIRKWRTRWQGRGILIKPPPRSELLITNSSAFKGRLVSDSPRIALAANRNIGVQAMRMLLEHQLQPVALLVAKGRAADRSVQELVRSLPNVPLLQGKEFREERGIEMLTSLRVDYLLSIHFPYIIPQAVLDIPKFGALNLHPAFLPYNRGWHTPSWAILEGTPYGATLHWIDAGMDTGDVALQRSVDVLASDTANTLYARVLAAEIEILRDAIPLLKSFSIPRVPQKGQGTEHIKSDLKRVRRLDLDERLPVREVLRRIRALTTNRDEEAAWFEIDGERYLVQLTIRKDHSAAEQPALKIFRAA